MVRSLDAHATHRQNDRRDRAKRILRGGWPLMAIIAGFAAVALLIDFCFGCVMRAMT